MQAFTVGESGVRPDRALNSALVVKVTRPSKNHRMVFSAPRSFLRGSPILLIRTESHRAHLCGDANIESCAQMSMLPRILAIVPTAQFRRLRLWRIAPVFD
ncbi:hypothetical protein [Mesorhizobium sp.]|uniref:hypothetical protein n=1 Tax=Mesorhizobium sp. TaxID=1871066 RepID=UPI000FEA61E2|nr:hypothetical protein [Mesorhizobium sp.]RWE54922.1 MAG: hypothetical protein EOS67_24695 [Mesorhizobium sp.]